MKPLVSLRHALTDPALLGHALPGPSWMPWRTLMIASVGEALTAEERVVFAEFTGREREPGEPVVEFWGVKGRRAGGTRAGATLAVYLGGLCDHSDALASGERGTIPILAASTTQATRAFGHAVGILETSPRLSKEIESATSDTIRLKTAVDIEIRPANFRTIRGVTSIAAIADELAFWSIEGSANPDREILDALRPSLITTGGLLWIVSSPYAQKGELYLTFKRDYGQQGDPLVLVAKGSSKAFNPTLPQSIIDRAYERDAAVAASEYGGEFRKDLEAFVSLELIEAAVDAGVVVRPPRQGVQYIAHIDAASGTGKDSYAAAIGHAEGDVAIIDVALEIRPPFNPQIATAEVVALLKSFGITRCKGDKYAAGFVVEAFAKQGVSYEYSENDTSQNYIESLSLFTSGRARLVDNKRLVSQFASLERRTTISGRDRVDHGSGDKHDDISAAAASVLAVLATKKASFVVSSELLTRALSAPPRGFVGYEQRQRQANTMMRIAHQQQYERRH